MLIQTLIQDHAAELHSLIEHVRSGSLNLVEKLVGPSSRDQCEHLISRLSDDLRLISDLLDKESDREGLAREMHHFMITRLNHGPTLKNLADHLGYSEKYCSDLFRAKMGISFSKYLKHLRIEKAKLLLTKQNTIAQVAEILGYSDQFAFSHSFKKTVGCSPRQFRARCRFPVSA